MTDQETQEAPPAEAAPPRKKGFVVFGIVGLALVLGGGAGVFVVGPRLAAKAKAGPAEVATPEPEHAAEPGTGIMLKLENIIVNPAGSQGTRFLMASVAFEFPDSRTEDRAREREVEVRDAVIGVLSSTSWDALLLPGARDTLKRQLALAVAPIVSSDRLRVFLPQFVLQ